MLPVTAAASETNKNIHEGSDSQVLLQSNKENVAMQHDPAEGEEASHKSSRRLHGRALPQ
jgi:hypothetical protein